MKTYATLPAAVSCGILLLGTAACDGGEPKAAPSPTGTAPSAAAASTPTATPPSRPKASDSLVVVIDPSGKKYTRKQMVESAAGMAAVTKEHGALPSDFCAKSYKDGIDGGGKFPAGKRAFMEACQEGIKLAA